MQTLRVASLAAIMLQVPLPGQQLLWRVEGIGDQLKRGSVVRAIGDVNGDGWEDMIELVTRRTAPGTFCCVDAGLAITSGRDGSILSVGQPLTPGLEAIQLGSFARTGDMDQDGVPDYAYTRYDSVLPATWDVVVRSGRDHHLIWMVSRPFHGSGFGLTVAGDLDVNGDGRNDLITADVRAGNYGTIYVYDNSGALLYQVVNQDPNVVMATQVAGAGDIDGDGCDDFLAVGPDVTNRGVIWVVSGRTGNIIRTCYGELPGDSLYNVAGCGDIDGDGVPDFVGGAHDLAPACVTTFSGATGQKIFSYRSPTPGPQACMSWGRDLSSRLDLDQDGIPDIVTSGCGWTYALNGRTGDEMFVLRHDNLTRIFPQGPPTPTLLRPPPGDLYPLLVIAEDGWQSQANTGTLLLPGVVRSFRTSPPTVSPYGRASASTPAVPRMGMRDLAGAPTRFTLSDAGPGAIAFLVLGMSDRRVGSTRLPQSLGPLGFPNILLQTSPDAVLFTLAGTSGIQRGYARIDVPMQFSATGVAIYAQWLWFDPANPSLHGSTCGHAFRVR